MTDHDRLFKELLTTFFWEFLELFLPNVLDYLDRDFLTFLPQEVFSDVTSGEKREVDLLAQVRFQETSSLFVIHIENQSTSQTEFNRRMFHYFARLDEKYALPIYPVAVFSFDAPYRPEPSTYSVTFPDCRVLDFNFATIQLNRLNWRTFVNQPNPVAAALMSKMKIKSEDRPKVKLECLRMLATLQLDPARTQLISGFVDTYLRLNATEKQTFQQELTRLELVEEEQVMEIVTSWMEEGIERGIQQGIEQGIERGIERGIITLVLRLLNRRLGELSPELVLQVQQLSREQAETLFDAALDFRSQDDLVRWLEQNQ